MPESYNHLHFKSVGSTNDLCRDECKKQLKPAPPGRGKKRTYKKTNYRKKHRKKTLKKRKIKRR